MVLFQVNKNTKSWYNKTISDDTRRLIEKYFVNLDLKLYNEANTRLDVALSSIERDSLENSRVRQRALQHRIKQSCGTETALTQNFQCWRASAPQVIYTVFLKALHGITSACNLYKLLVMRRRYRRFRRSLQSRSMVVATAASSPPPPHSAIQEKSRTYIETRASRTVDLRSRCN